MLALPFLLKRSRKRNGNEGGQTEFCGKPSLYAKNATRHFIKGFESEFVKSGRKTKNGYRKVLSLELISFLLFTIVPQSGHPTQTSDCTGYHRRRSLRPPASNKIHEDRPQLPSMLVAAPPSPDQANTTEGKASGRWKKSKKTRHRKVPRQEFISSSLFGIVPQRGPPTQTPMRPVYKACDPIKKTGRNCLPFWRRRPSPRAEPTQCKASGRWERSKKTRHRKVP